MLGVAIHGAGSVAAAHAASWLKNDHATIASVSSRNIDSARQFIDQLQLDCPAHASLEEVLRDDSIDIVDLTGPNHVHASQAIAVAEAGRHVMVEKPIAITDAENRALRDAVAKAGVKSVAGLVLRWNPLLENLKALLGKGTIGELIYAEVDYWHGIASWYSGWDWAHRRKTGGSAMLFGGCHAADALRWLVGDQVTEVCAFSNNHKALYEYDANVVAIVKFAGGTIGKVSALLDSEMPYAFNIDLAGTEGTLRDNRLWSKKLLPHQNDWAILPTIMPDSGDVAHHPFDAQINELVECIRNDQESHCNMADSYHTHALCLAIDKSIALGGKTVRVETE